jgi:hypothetical protein
MGTDAEVIVFEYETYLTTVVPAFIDFIREGRVVDWLQPFLKRRDDIKPELWDRTESSRIGNVLLSDLSWAGPYDLEYTYGHDWQQRWSMVSDPFDSHEMPAANLSEQITSLFNFAVSINCLGTGQFVGRSRTVSDYAKLLRQQGLQKDDRIVELLAALGKRGFIIGYKFGAGFEGINGWLDKSETAELAERLSVLRLPRYEVSFAAMERFRRSTASSYGNYVRYECPGVSFEELSLSFVRTTATIAAAENRGLLWGNGVTPPQWLDDKSYY